MKQFFRPYWKKLISNSITDEDQLPEEILISEEEVEYLHSIKKGGVLPFVINPWLLSQLTDSLRKHPEIPPGKNPWRIQLIPSPMEKHILDTELSDPLGEANYRIFPRLVHQYQNRVLMLTTGSCISYCRHCFRRCYTSRGEGFITLQEQLEVGEYLKSHTEVKEILVSGGDPLLYDDSKINNLLKNLRRFRKDLLIRICTRSPVFLPQRFTKNLVKILSSYKPLWLIPHINHPWELTRETEKSLKTVINAGIPVQSQTVLLKNVNDNPDILEELFNRLVFLGVKPGYLFQTDLAPGTSHLRTPVDEGIKIYTELEKRLSGLSLPVYAVDLPGGGGKIPLISHKVEKSDDVYYYYKSKNGRTYTYPKS